MLITTVTGNVNLEGSSASASIGAIGFTDGGGVKTQPVRSALGVTAVGRPVMFPAIADLTVSQGGGITRAVHDMAEGVILRLKLNRRGNWGSVAGTCCQFIYVREDAPLHRIRFRLTDNEQAVEPFALVEGRFDILTLEEAATFNVTVPPAFAKLYTVEKCELMGATAEVIEAGVRRRVVEEVIGSVEVRNESGTLEVRPLRRKKRSRAINFNDL